MRFQSVRGVNDILPDESYLWQVIQNRARRVFQYFGFQEIIIPIIEDADLFKRSLGISSEVVEKQMFLIERNDTTLALRPEGTASAIRTYLENNLDKKTPFVKLYYIGPMFRAERPQKGRLRQFNHIGAEVIGSNSPYVDAEVISLSTELLKTFGITNFKIRLNSLGSARDKKKFAKILRDILELKLKSFCKDCQNRYKRNVFRLLDCKKESCRKLVESLDFKASDYLSEEEVKRFNKIKECLDLLKIDYIYDPYLVRGLDYYTGTVFEITHPKLGAQDAIGAGGRYDTLVKELGGPDVGAIGFALGVERMILAIDRSKIDTLPPVKIYIAALGEAAFKKGLVLAQELRTQGESVVVDYEDRRLDKKFTRANRLGVKFIGILGEDELSKNVISIKDLSSGKQEEVRLDIEAIRRKLC